MTAEFYDDIDIFIHEGSTIFSHDVELVVSFSISYWIAILVQLLDNRPLCVQARELVVGTNFRVAIDLDTC